MKYATTQYLEAAFVGFTGGFVIGLAITIKVIEYLEKFL